MSKSRIYWLRPVFGINCFFFGDKTEVTPERLVRAFEMIERHGRKRGLQRLKDKDPGLAAKVQRFHEEKQQPSRRNNQQNKNE